MYTGCCVHGACRPTSLGMGVGVRTVKLGLREPKTRQDAGIQNPQGVVDRSINFAHGVLLLSSLERAWRRNDPRRPYRPESTARCSAHHSRQLNWCWSPVQSCRTVDQDYPIRSRLVLARAAAVHLCEPWHSALAFVPLATSRLSAHDFRVQTTEHHC